MTVKHILLILLLSVLFLACESKQKGKSVDFDTTGLAKTEHNTPMIGQNEESVNTYEILLGINKKDGADNIEPNGEDVYTFGRLKQEFKEAFDIIKNPIGTYFWDEFEDLETQYGLTEEESKLLGEWLNVDYNMFFLPETYNSFPLMYSLGISNTGFIDDITKSSHPYWDPKNIYNYYK